MKRLIIAVVTALHVGLAPAAVVLGSDGIWYGNICVSNIGWAIVPFQPIGSMCIVPGPNVYGVIINR